MYRRDAAAGGSITFVGPSSEWIRIDVLAIADDRVLIGFDWPEAYRPRSDGRRVRLGRFRVRVLKFIGADRVQLGIDMPPGFHSVAREQPQHEAAPTDIPAPMVPATKHQGQNRRTTAPASAHARQRLTQRHRRRGRTYQDNAGHGARRRLAAENAMPAPVQLVSKRALKRLLGRNYNRLR
jgi:hypothetical protein